MKKGLQVLVHQDLSSGSQLGLGPASVTVGIVVAMKILAAMQAVKIAPWLMKMRMKMCNLHLGLWLPTCRFLALEHLPSEVPAVAARLAAVLASQARFQVIGVQHPALCQAPPPFSGRSVDKSLHPLCRHCHTLGKKAQDPLEAPARASLALVQQGLEQFEVPALQRSHKLCLQLPASSPS